MSDGRGLDIHIGQEECLARIRATPLDAEELASRYGQDGRRAPGALSADIIHVRLETLVFMVLSMRRSVRPSAEALAWFPAERVEALFGHLERVARTSLELTYHLCVHSPEILRHLPDEAIHDWIMGLLDSYDRSGTQGALRILRHVAEDARARRDLHRQVRFAEIAPVLESFVTGLAGRGLRLETGEAVLTDTETLFLPPVLSRFAERDDNFRLYKAIVAHLWAQIWFGTWREPALVRLAGYPDPRQVLDLFQSLEGLRLDARLAAELPGLWREMRRLAGRAALAPVWRAAAERVAHPEADAALSWTLAGELHAAGVEPLEPVCYQGVLDPQRVAEVSAARIARERERLAVALARIADEQGVARRATAGEPPTFRVDPEPDDDWPDGFAFQLRLGDQPVRPIPETVQLLQSIAQDFGHIPPEFLEAAGQGVYQHQSGQAREDAAPAPASGAFLYDEWDAGRQGYRKGWCQLREKDVHPQPDDFVAATRHKYRGLLKHLYRTFEAIRGEERLIKREPFGDDLDIDALVEAHADRTQGLEMTDRLFLRRRKLDRHLAVLFMVDMSGSTKGWINDAQRESLVLLCEALERLGDRYAIHGFSGYTHTRCDSYRVKDFAEPYDAKVQARISGIRPQDYTRMGVAIRHLTRKLLAVEARTRVLIVLSDGRPDDEDGYRGDYGIEDTRQAVLEARGRGVHPFCITIDDQAQAYLPHVFGPAGYVLVEKVDRLPLRVSEIYRRMTV
ncbi:VWA domain-containing protein [uncultured Thiocystis sp.]|jgi:nitric oxide reductase NorD protein|uniref:VWA domain-containing protein n=1 Tax=uncultured Thiocystis sp. TaxID=1202134 RepID=UPI0025FBC043|nr:VWA domain-containing protein [uncultured Thiocystis sp.]